MLQGVTLLAALAAVRAACDCRPTWRRSEGVMNSPMERSAVKALYELRVEFGRHPLLDRLYPVTRQRVSKLNEFQWRGRLHGEGKAKRTAACLRPVPGALGQLKNISWV